MKSPAALLVLFLASIGLLAWGIGSAQEAALLVTSTTPDVDIERREHDRYAIKLPGLKYELQIEVDCPAGLVPDSMLLSVADTRKRIRTSEIQSGVETGITMNIPARQIAPLAVEGFCLDSMDDNNRGQDVVTVRGVLSAQASLLCADENDQQITYASQLLDVTLTCEAP